jgi:hypothetical protein
MAVRAGTKVVVIRDSEHIPIFLGLPSIDIDCYITTISLFVLIRQMISCKDL